VDGDPLESLTERSLVASESIEGSSEALVRA
jgi:hypothetical protein